MGVKDEGMKRRQVRVGERKQDVGKQLKQEGLGEEVGKGSAG